MESPRFLLAIVLMIAVIVAVNLIFPPVRPQPSAPPDSAASATPSASAPQPAAVTPVPPPPTAQPPLATPDGNGVTERVDTVVVQSPLYRFGISTRGAALVSAELLQYESFTRPLEPGSTVRPPVQLAPNSAYGLISTTVRIDGNNIDFRRVPFTADRQADVLLTAESEPVSLRFSGTDPQSGQQLALTYTFRPNDYLIQVTAVTTPGGRSVQYLLNVGPTLAVNEANAGEDLHSLAYVVNSRQQGIQSVPLQNLRARGDRTGTAVGLTRVEEGPLDWIALKNKYFLVAALPDAPTGQGAFGGLVAADLPGRYTADLKATLPAGPDHSAAYRLYVGPQEYDRQVAIGLEDVNPRGWRWIRPIVTPLGHAFTWILLATHRATGLGYGWVLILFGIAVRLALWPLNARAMRSQMKNMELQPRIKDIQTRLKANPELMQKEMLKLYREEGFNPMGGCLPLLLPMPVLITLFFVLQATIEFRGVSFLWLPDLSRADPLYILPILLGITMFISQWLSLKSSPPNPQAQMMLWFMPAFMVLLFLNFASGLNLYYSAQNFASFPQQLQLIRERKAFQAARGIK